MKLLPPILSILIAQAAGLIGSFFTMASVEGWYTTLTLPVVAPPSWMFAPVWVTLYALMGIAAYLVWQQRTAMSRPALAIYGVHLVFNVLWSVIFFGLKNPGLAFAELMILLAIVVLTTVLFWRIHRRAGTLMLPYIAWVSFAAYLNYTIWMLN